MTKRAEQSQNNYEISKSPKLAEIIRAKNNGTDPYTHLIQPTSRGAGRGGCVALRAEISRTSGLHQEAWRKPAGWRRLGVDVSGR